MELLTTSNRFEAANTSSPVVDPEAPVHDEPEKQTSTDDHIKFMSADAAQEPKPKAAKAFLPKPTAAYTKAELEFADMLQ